MKKFLLAAMSVSLIATPILATAPAQAQARNGQVVKYKPNGNVVVQQRNNRGIDRQVAVRQQRQAVRQVAVRQQRQAIRQQRQIARQWQRGQRFDRNQAQRFRVVNDWRAYQGRRLYAPPRGQQWVQSGNDAVLVAIASGLIGAVIGGAFN